jgi:glycosyltransferase involved in cell wall biosynthesis
MINITYAVDAPYAGGAERYIELLATSLDPERFRVSMLVKAEPGLAAWAKGIEESGIELIEVPMDLPYHPEQFPRIAESIRSLKPHIVHVNMPGPYDAQMGLLVPLARVGGASRVVVTEHLPMVAKSAKRGFLKSCAYRWVDRVATVCEANVPYLTERQGVPPEKIVVVHNALPAAYGRDRMASRAKVRSELAVAGDTIAVCIVGSLIRRKGHTHLVEAISSLPGLPWHLVIIGEGQERDALERELRDRDIRGRTSMLGQQSPGEVERLLAGMDLLVLPSAMEAFPYTILEAMACGLPVIASRIYGIPEAAVEGESALLFDPAAGGALRQTLERLLGDETLRLRLGKNGRARFEKLFTLDTHLQRMQSIYIEMLHAR